MNKLGFAMLILYEFPGLVGKVEKRKHIIFIEPITKTTTMIFSRSFVFNKFLGC